LAVANVNSNTLQIYRFNGSGVPTSLGTVPTASYPDFAAWSPDGRFLAVVSQGSSSTGLQVYRFNGSSLPALFGTVGTGSAPFTVVWSPDGRFLATVNGGSNTLQIYRFNGSGAPTSLGTVNTGIYPYSVAWSPDGRFLAVANVSSSTLQVFHCNFYYTGQPAQAFTNGLLFGNSVLGSTYDANVQVLAGAVVKVKGMVKDDSF
jgi:6-phosphogluconolactonase (cycloisomerase 2 family)